VLLAFSAAFLLVGGGCGGSGKGQGIFTGTLDQRFTLSAIPATLSIPSGGSGYLTVSAVRYGGLADAIDLSVEGLPPGVTATGSIAAGELTGRLIVSVADGVAAQSLGSLSIKGSSGTRSQTAPLALAVLAPLPPSALSPSLVQAGGGGQSGGNLENHPIVLEPVTAAAATDSSGNQEVRHGFLPVPQPANP